MKNKLISTIFCIGLPIYILFIWHGSSMLGFPDGHLTQFGFFLKIIHLLHMISLLPLLVFFVLSFLKKIQLKKVILSFLLLELLWVSTYYVALCLLDNGQGG